jgi:hypothetical protein
MLETYQIIPVPENNFEEGAFVLSIIGEGFNKSISVKNREELKLAYEGRFKDFVKAAEFLIPEKEEQIEEENSED